MSPLAVKYKASLNLPTILPDIDVGDYVVTGGSVENTLTIAHSAKTSKDLMKDWMKFTHVLGSGIYNEI